MAKAQDKISEWLHRAEAFARVIPSHDAVLQNTLQILQGFSKLIPVLSKLTSLMLNQKHWINISKGKIVFKTSRVVISYSLVAHIQNIIHPTNNVIAFVEIGLLYDPRKLTLGELMSKELQENQNRINKVK